MLNRKLFACASAFALALEVGCSQDPESPESPVSPTPISGATGAGPNGETLKANAPTPQSPVNGAQPDTLVLTAGKSSGSFDQGLSGSYTYEFQIMNAANTLVCASSHVPGGAGSSVSWTPTCSLDFDANYTWRVRATTQNPAGQMANGPWSSTASFKSPVGAYISNAPELFDPLTDGKTVGTRVGATQFIPGKGIELMTHESYVTYTLPRTLEVGEFSLMATGIDEGSPGDKSKVMSMMEGGGDITTNDYRMTVEKRGRLYPDPGAVTFRIISGDSRHESGRVNDGNRVVVPMNDETWYFWKFSWGNNRATLEVREGSPTGRTIYSSSVGMGGFIYRPTEHRLFLGAPTGRAGPQDATVPGMIIKNVWVSGRARPTFPGLLGKP